MKYLSAHNVKVTGKFTIQTIKDIKISAKTNEHSTIYVKGIIPAEIGMEEIQDKCFKEPIKVLELDENGKEKKYGIFEGIILNTIVKEEGNFYEIEINGISASYLFDIEKKKRSFQNVNMTYAQLIKEAIGDNKVICTIGKDRQIKIPLIQYNETDWEFARRLASHFNKPIQADILTGNPRIWFGVRLGNDDLKGYEPLFDTNTYNICISSKYYEVGKKLGFSKAYYITYKIKDGRNFHIGDKVLFQDKKLIICEKEVTFEKGEIVFYYTLAREQFLNVLEYYNSMFTGLTLIGEVIKTSSEKVWLKLDIDGKDGEYDYNWKPTSGNLMYCMPKIGTKASLYFKSEDERSGIATNSPRTNGGNDEKSDLSFEGFSNVQNRGMVTEHNKRMDMYPSILRFKGVSNDLLFDDEIGIKFESHKIIDIVAFDNILIESEKNQLLQSYLQNLFIRTNSVITDILEQIVSKGTYAMLEKLNEKKALVELPVLDNDTMFIMNNRVDMLSHINILYQGRVYKEFPPFNDAPKEGKFNWIGLIGGIVVGAIAIAVTAALLPIAIPTSGLVIAGVLGLGAKALSDIASGNVSSVWEYGKLGFTIALDAAMGASVAKLFGKVAILKNGASCSKKIQNTIITVTGTTLEETASGFASRALEIALDDELTFKDNTFDYLFSKKEIATDVAFGLLFGGLEAKHIIDISDPVDAITGSYLVQQCDLIINDILEDVAIERNYQSIHNTVSLIGKGWNLSIFSHLEFEGNYIKLHTFNNKKEIFYINEQNEIKSIRNEEETFLVFKIEDGYKIYNILEKQTLIYKENGLLLYVIDNKGNKREYIYENDILKRINFASGQYFEFEIKENKIRKITDNINREIKYEYDGDYLISVKIPNGGVERYNYNEQGLIESVINTEGVTFVNNKYDDKNRVIYQTISTGQEYKIIYDDKNRVNTYIIPKMNREVKYYYDEKNEPIKTVYQDGTYEEIKCDIWQNVIYKRDRLGNETRYSYNKRGLKTEEHLPNGLSTYYEYDEKHNLIKEWDNFGKEYHYIYDEKGNVIRSIAKIDEERELTLTYEYDKYGRVIKQIDAEGREKIFEYNFLNGEFNKPTKYITNEENEYNYTYDRAGRCRTVENKYGIRAFEYDAMDIMRKQINQLNNITTYEYDQMFNLKKVILPNNIEEGIGTSYEYDAFHKLLKTKDEEGNIYATPRDYEGNLLKEINPNSYDIKTNDGEGITYEYDEYDNKIKVIYPDGAIERIKYDANGNIIKIIAPEQYDENTDDGAGYTYEYDCMDRLVQITDARYNIIKRYVYDLKGNIIKEINADGYKTGSNDEERKGILYKYNKMNWLTEKREPITKTKYSLTTYEYDLTGNLIKENRYIEYQTEESYTGEKHTISFTYDKDNRRIKVSDCTGAVQEYSYNIFNKVSKERRKIDNKKWQEIEYNYDKSGRLIEVKRLLENEVNAITKYEYDKNGNITKIKTPNGYEIIREYDKIDRLISERHIEKGGIDNTTKFGYDKASNLVEITDNRGRKTKIEYDLLNREIRRIEKDGSITRKYYNLNGLLSKQIKGEQYKKEEDNGLGYQYNYNPMGQLITVIAPNGKVVQTNTYDANGRIISQIDGEGSGVNYEYDLMGNRTLIKTKGEAKQSFEYDARGNIKGVTDGENNKTKYILDKWGRIEGVEKADGSVEKYEYDYTGNIISSTDGENNKTEYIYNTSGQITTIIDPSGEKEQYFYDLENRLKEKIDRNGVITQYNYNMYQNLLYRKTKDNSLQEIYKYSKDGYLESAISKGMQYNYTYDIMGRIASKSASGKTLISYEYDKNGNKIKEIDVTGKITQFEYNELDLLKYVSYNGNEIATYDYYNNGLIKNVKNGSIEEQYSYDKDLNLSSLSVTHNEELIVSNKYKYDRNGNRRSKQMFDRLTRYFYTEIGQLKRVKSQNYEEELFYDKANNRTKRIVNGEEELYNYDNRNRLIKFTKNGQETSFKWDNAGNLLKDDKANYTYNEFNQTTKVETFDGNVQINKYDAEGLRYEMEGSRSYCFYE